MMAEHPFGGQWRLIYFDGNGQRTERTVDAIAIATDDDGCELRAYCHLRGGERTFLASRIASMINIQTGEALRELGGVKLVSEADRRVASVESWFTGSSQFVADACLLIAQGVPPRSIVEKMLAEFPDLYVGEVDVPTFILAMKARWDNSVDRDAADVTAPVKDVLMVYEREPEEFRRRLIGLLFETVKISPLPEQSCIRLMEGAGEALGLNVKISRK